MVLGFGKSKETDQGEMYLIVGLGNPGEDYERTRHNAGKLTVDLLAHELGVNYWKTECGSSTGKTKYRDLSVILAKPHSFMNVSGSSVKELCKKYKVDPDHLIVIHDELDIEAGTVRVKQGGGHGGHNGLRSLVDKLQTRDWYRVRIGVGRPPGRMDPADYVLSVPKKKDEENFEHACHLGADATLSLLSQGLEKTQQQYN